jgi:hypothetical protein
MGTKEKEFIGSNDMLSKSFTFKSRDNGFLQVFLFILNLWSNTQLSPKISLLNSLLFFKPLIENPCMFLSFANSSMIFLFFVHRSCRRSLCFFFFRYSCVFSKPLFLLLLFLLVGLATLIKILRILFTGILHF